MSQHAPFTKNDEPKDEILLTLLKQAYTGQLLCVTALIHTEGIHPFSAYHPRISDDYRAYFETLERQNTPPPLYVYPKDDYFIMSDDYRAYFLYKEKRYTSIMCVVLGVATSPFVKEKSEPFRLPVPEIEERDPKELAPSQAELY